MLGAEFKLVSPLACDGERGAYIGHAFYVLPGRQTHYRQVDLGRQRPDIEDPAALLYKVRKHLTVLLGQHIPVRRMVALGVSRVCFNAKHAGEARPNERSVTLERVAAIAIARSLDDVEPILPIIPNEMPSGHGFGMGRRPTPHTRVIRPLIHLPVTPQEWREQPVGQVVRSLPATGMSDDPYVALHGNLERIITPDLLN